MPRQKNAGTTGTGTGMTTPMDDGRFELNGVTYRLQSRQDVRTTALHYLMYPWLVTGGLNILSGEGGSRKSTFAAWIIAQATRGNLKDENGDSIRPSKVLLVHQYEEDDASIIYPRLDMMHADSSLYRLLDTTQPSPVDGSPVPAFPSVEDMKKGLITVVLDWDPDLIVFDPITLLIEGDTNSRKDVQPALVYCNAIAQAKRPRTVLGIHHRNKAGRFSGSQKFEDTARSFMDIAIDPTKKETSIVTIGKANNNAAKSMRLISATYPYVADDGKKSGIQIIERIEDTDLTVDDIRQIRASGDDVDDVMDQDTWLRDYLMNHDPSGVPRKQVVAEGFKNGYSESQLKRALNRIGGTSARIKKAAGGSLWRLPRLPHGSRD